MIFLKKTLLQEIRTHVAAHRNIEACGVLCSFHSPHQPERCYPMRNSACSEKYFMFDAQEQFNVFQEIDNEGGQICAVFHSHLDSDAYPSQTDRMHLANMGSVHQIICAYHRATNLMKERCFLIAEDLILEERIKIID